MRTKGRYTSAAREEQSGGCFLSIYTMPEAKFQTCEIADFTPSAHAQGDIPSHAFRKHFTEISNMLRTDD